MVEQRPSHVDELMHAKRRSAHAWQRVKQAGPVGQGEEGLLVFDGEAGCCSHLKFVELHNAVVASLACLKLRDHATTPCGEAIGSIAVLSPDCAKGP